MSNTAPQPRRKLGRGLGSLLNPQTTPATIDIEQITNTSPPIEMASGSVDIERIVASPFQPRRDFDESEIAALADSIRRDGLLQPVVVRPRDGGWFELIAGERRWRAARSIGLTRIPAVVRDVDDGTAAALALIENLQRKDLNPVERAEALRSLQQRGGMTQQQVAERVGIDRATVANLLRLLDLEPEILTLIARGALSAGHGKALLSADPGPRRLALAKAASEHSWSVRTLEAKASEKQTPAPNPAASATLETVKNTNPDLMRLERQLSEHLASRVVISVARGGDRGEIRVSFYSLEHFDGLLSKIGFVPSDL